MKLMKSLKPKKRRVAVIMGGPSAEHEVSLASGKMVVKHLNKDRYEVQPIVIGKDGRWPTGLKEVADNCDLAFLATHGEYGEDGQLQRLLEKNKVAFTGSVSKVSKLAMDKAQTNKLLVKSKITCPFSINLKRSGGQVDWKKFHYLTLPVVVKPTDRGSSVGVSIVNSISKLAPAIKNAMAYSDNIMIEKYIKGRELTCAVLECNGKIEALPPTEIIPKAKFFDYKAKYTKGAAREITPPRNLEEKTQELIKQTAIKVYRAVGCRSHARVDMILDKNGGLHVLEINTLPGLTKNSLLPQAAKAAGIDFSQLLDIIVNNAK